MDIRIKDAVSGVATSISNDPVFSPSLITFFNVNPAEITAEDKKKLAEIDKMIEGDDLAKIQHLRTLRMRLATPTLGQSDIDNLHKYLKLNGAVKEKTAQLEAMEANANTLHSI